jgi:hypothetical protein
MVGPVSRRLSPQGASGEAPLGPYSLSGGRKSAADEIEIGERAASLLPAGIAGQTIVLVEQNLAATLALANRAYILNNGHIVHESSPEEIKSQPDILRRHLGV